MRWKTHFGVSACTNKLGCAPPALVETSSHEKVPGVLRPFAAPAESLPKTAEVEESQVFDRPPRFSDHLYGILPVERDPSHGVDDAGALVTVGENRGQCDGVEAGGVQRAVPGSGRAMPAYS